MDNNLRDNIEEFEELRKRKRSKYECNDIRK